MTELTIEGSGAAAVPGALATLVDGIERGLHPGAMLYASIDGKPVADVAVGEARAGTPMTPDSLVIWFSMTKPSVAVSIAQQWERGALELDDPVVRFLPEFGAHGKDRITLRHLLTHTAGIRGGDAVASTAPGTEYWDEIVAGICAIEPETDWIPGQRAGYHLSCGMTILAEIVHRLDGRRFETYVREEVFAPLGMADCWVGMPADVVDGYGVRIGTMHSTAAGKVIPLDMFDAPDVLARCVPGGGGRGPLRQLGRLYEALLARGELDGRRVLLPQTVEAITAHHRVGLYDETFHARCDWGLGFAVDAYAMGRHASPRAFGHGGALSAISFADPEHGLVAVVQTNGMCGNDDHYLRLDAVTTALYEDLGLAAPGSPGRDKPFPSVELTAPAD
ncbi:MAG TPA: serine hydrolase domain-containing protein [Acidimicrobiia bacterium]|jgi:CubicO group peptidase (beta-lactamase class C family)